MFTKLGEARHILNRVPEVEAIEKIVQDHPICIERRSRVEPFRFAPREKALDIASGDRLHIGLRRNVLRKQVQNVIVFLRRGLAESPDVFEEFFDRLLERDSRVRFDGLFDRESEWRENGRRQRQAAGTTAAEALEAQRRKRLELEAKARGSGTVGPRAI